MRWSFGAQWVFWRSENDRELTLTPVEVDMTDRSLKIECIERQSCGSSNREEEIGEAFQRTAMG